MRSFAWALVACLAAAVPARSESIIDQLREKDVPQTSRLNFSGSTDARFADGGKDITPFNFNNVNDAGGVSTFTALKLHLFLDATLSKRTSLFVKVGGGSPDLGRFSLDAMSVNTKLGEDWPDLQVGRFLNNFGKFPQRFLGPDNPLIGDPLLYTYVTSLSTGQVPLNVFDLLSQRGRGVASRFVGYPAPARGQAIVSNVWYLNGLKFAGSVGRLSYSAALTNDAVSASNFFDVNDNKAATIHLGYKPDIAWQIGMSFSTSTYLDHTVRSIPRAALIKVDDFRQNTFGVDIDYAEGPFSIFGEYMHNSWDTPFVAESLRINGFFIEPRYKVMPGLSLVLRFDALFFSDVNDGVSLRKWEFDVNRTEFGLNYNIERDLIVKTTYQFNHTTVEAGSEPDDNLYQAQLVAVF